MKRVVGGNGQKALASAGNNLFPGPSCARLAAPTVDRGDVGKTDEFVRDFASRNMAFNAFG